MLNLKSVALTILELIAFNAQNLGVHVTLAIPPFRKIFKRSCPDCPWDMHVKFEVHTIALTVLNWSD